MPYKYIIIVWGMYEENQTNVKTCEERVMITISLQSGSALSLFLFVAVLNMILKPK